MALTQLESDLLMELSTRGRRVRELLQFVALHGERDKSVPAAATLDAVIERWTARGWLATGEVMEAHVQEPVLTDWRILRAGAAPVTAGSSQAMLWLTDVARRDVPWLPQPASGALHRHSQEVPE